ncbi:MAG: Flp pilus assembly protein CpaB [Candidatus Dadabacteria bacterium]|nr:MAG: Flp pilus assembly protein CpaB [Candidatus Dadabacteria bacterium]
MSKHFGGVGPINQGDRAKTLALVCLFLFVVFGVVGYLILFQPGPEKATAKTVVVEKEPEVKMVEVLVPIREIQPATPLEPAMFRKEPRPQVGIDSRVIKSYEEIKGHFARSLIVPGQPLHRSYITSVKPTNEITAKIPEGYRAVTIRVDARTSVEGFTRPGARVDVVWSTTLNGKPAVRTIVENAKVLSAERQTETDAMKQAGVPVPSTVSLLVTAQDAQKIQLASTTGSLSLSLRGDTDVGKGSGAGVVTVDDLIRQGGKDGKDDSLGTVTMNGIKYKITRDGKLIRARGSGR